VLTSLSPAVACAGLILEFELRDKTRKSKEIVFGHNLTPDCEIDTLVDAILSKEPLISITQRPQVHNLLCRLHDKLKHAREESSRRDFYLFKVLRAHILPLTNCAFNKSGDKFITGSYDRTCKIFETETGNELLTLEGHRNVVYAIAFNNPYGDRILTGSFDKTCKLWHAETGELCQTYCGHEMEIVCLDTNPVGTNIATGSMDGTARLYDIETGTCLHTLAGHNAEIVSLNYDTLGKHLITGSFDNTARLWDVRQGRSIHTFVGHCGEISSTQFNFSVSATVGWASDFFSF